METTCPGCGSKLRVADSLVGKRAKCSKCGAVLEIPKGPPAAAESDRAQAADLSQATPTQMVEELRRRGLGAVLVSFRRDEVDIEHFEDAKFEMAFSNDLTELQMRSIVLRMGIAAARQAAKSLPPDLPA